MRAKAEKEMDQLMQEREQLVEERDKLVQERDKLKQEKRKLEYTIGDLFKQKEATKVKIDHSRSESMIAVVSASDA